MKSHDNLEKNEGLSDSCHSPSCDSRFPSTQNAHSTPCPLKSSAVRRDIRCVVASHGHALLYTLAVKGSKFQNRTKSLKHNVHVWTIDLLQSNLYFPRPHPGRLYFWLAISVIFFSSAKEILSKNWPGIVVPDQFFARFANSAMKRGKFYLLVFPGISREPVAPGGVGLAAARPHSLTRPSKHGLPNSRLHPHAIQGNQKDWRQLGIIINMCT